MARAYLLSPKLSDSASLAASNAVSNAGISNVQKPRPSLAWRSTTTTPYFEGDFGSAVEVDTLGLGYLNGVSGDTFRLRLATSQANLTASPSYDSNDGYPSGVPVWPSGSGLSNYLYPHRVFAFTSQTCQWFRVDFNFSSNPAGFVQLSRLALGLRIEPSLTVQSGWSIAGDEPVMQTVDLGGEESPRIVGVRRSLRVVWQTVYESEKAAIEEMLLDRGTSKDLVVALDGSEGVFPMSRIAIGRVKESFTIPHVQLVAPGNEDTDHVYTVNLALSEMGVTEMRG